MRFFAPPTVLVLYSALPSEQCEYRLANAIDAKRSAIFSLSGYHGSKPFVGEIHDGKIRLLQRPSIYGRNAFPPVFSGELQAHGPGTRIVGTLDLEATSKIALCVLGAFGILVLIPILMYSLARHPVLSVLFAFAYVTLALGSPRIVRGNGLTQEKNIATFLRNTLQAEDVRTITS